MSDNIKFIIEIPKPMYESIQNGTYCGTLYEELKNGIPLDSVKAEIENKYREVEFMDEFSSGYNYAVSETLEVLDNIGKESEVKPND